MEPNRRYTLVYTEYLFDIYVDQYTKTTRHTIDTALYPSLKGDIHDEGISVIPTVYSLSGWKISKT